MRLFSVQWLVLGFLLVFLASCASSSKKDSVTSSPETAAVSEETADNSEHSENTEAEEQLEVEISDQAVQALRDFVDELETLMNSSTEPETPLARHQKAKVKKWLDYFTKKDRERFQRYLNRGQQYKDVVQTILEENGLPSELYYLAMIESGYSTHARSHAKAVGAWQFIRATGRRYGLESTNYIDERRDPIHATEGAVKYLRDLYNAFQSWELAMASYNCGEFRVFRTALSARTKDYWEITRRNLLPKETRDYVPKFFAALIIGRNPEKYGFVDPTNNEELAPYPSVIAVEVPAPVSLDDIAQASGVPGDELKIVNQHLLRGVTPPNHKSYEIWVPEKYVASVKQGSFAQYVKNMPNLPEVEDVVSPREYRVRNGDSLGRIARRFRVSVATLRRVNGLASDRIFKGQRLRITTASYSRPEQGGHYYLVRKGDTLGKIARRHGMTAEQLRRANGIMDDSLKVGQRLIVEQTKRSRSQVATSGSKYRVRPGDTLEKIARRHGISIVQLKEINGLKRDKIFVGQVLKVTESL